MVSYPIHTYIASLMRVFFRAGESYKAILLLKDMTSSNCTYNEYCYNVLIHGLCENEKLDEERPAKKRRNAGLA